MASSSISQDAKLQSLRGVFPDLDADVLTAVLTSHNGDADAAANVLLGMNAGASSEYSSSTPVPSHDDTSNNVHDYYSYDGYCRT